MDMNTILTTRDSKINFLKGQISLTKCDGVTDEREMKFFNQAAVSMGMNEEDIKELNEAWGQEKIDISFETSKEKMFFFIQAIQLCWMDNRYVEEEKTKMRQFAKELDISLEALEAVEKWAYEGIVWNKKGDELLELK